jgi:hypothetical protein
MNVRPVVFVLLIVTLFFGSVGIAKVTGKWHSSVSYEDYQRIIPVASQLDHP